MSETRIILLKKSSEQGIINSISYIEQICFSDYWSESTIRQEVLNKNSFWACSYLDNRMVGYGLVWIVAGDCQLLRLAVDPEYRRKGEANKIMNFLQEIAENNSCESIFLEVRESNLPAINLYESFDFKQVGVRKGYYLPEKEDALLYIKCLTC